ncbi:MAG TPA: serine--tRNA ligase [Micropepsaceae bacterium]|nr:serine--tRNA ligase [Micropepsaceae bacterium]
MHDIKAIRDDPAAFDEGLKKRGLAPLSGEVLKRDAELRALLTRLQTAQARRNEASKLIGAAKAKKDEAQAQALMAEVTGLKDEIQKGEEEERRLQAAVNDFLATIPNIPASDVPVGADEHANVEIRRWGTKPGFDFKPKEHFDLGEGLGQMDFEAAARMSGARFVVLKNQLARLERAIAQFMLDLHTEQARENNPTERLEIGGYAEVSPPLLVRDHTMFGTGQLPKFEEDQFFASSLFKPNTENEEISGLYFNKMPAGNLLANNFGEIKLAIDASGAKAMSSRFWLIPTAEVPLTNLVREQILDEKQFPLRFTAYTPCFRAEAGAAGKDTRGMIRMHQFSKVELVSIATPEQSAAEHERMTVCAQEVLKRLGLHHRVIVLSTGDMGFGARKTYDIEVWLPGQDAFREISSCSNCGDFQARRMNARYRPQGEKNTRFVHTLNGSGLAVGRTLVAILENYQQADGSILIPEALKPYMGGLDRIAR